MSSENILIIGCGGLGREVLWAWRRAQALAPESSSRILGFAAETPPEGQISIDGLPFLGLVNPGLMALGPIAPTHFICAIGSNQARKRISLIMENMGLRPCTVVDPSVLMGPGVIIGGGSYVGAGSILSPSSRLGAHVVINHGCSIGHDANIEDFSQACPGTRISGWVQVGEGALLGSNSVAAPKVSLGAWSTLGASSMANRNLPSGATALGIPGIIVFQKPLPPNRQEPI